MVDIQNEPDSRDVPLEKVGIKGLKYPVHVLDRDRKIQNTTASVNLYVNLPRHFKGTHMSRFIEVFHSHREKLSMPHFLDMLEEIRLSLDAARAFGEMTFPFFIEKKAPVSGQSAMMSYECSFEGTVSGCGGQGVLSPVAERSTFYVSVAAPVQTVCPCSKAISDYGAHNQRGMVRVKLELGPFFWIEDMVALIESCASSAVYTLLKREDEKYVTETAYDNPKFVEDMVRDVLLAIPQLGAFPWYSVEAENFESIHNHSAFAYAEYPPGIQKGDIC
ncbi:GTP cyclohydrolase FolE2 [Brucepastera parasyntrophica]|uniref:GTP cyclohydrolase FolE2 n=1 Tax=Brucepastera parasyntrophica TaxID=2880008 RepID=UPI00210B84C8|nr:GTP cyclohydrolase FolE2 [Brucepastera parasyntrophica]ULQ60602.1 GTP cyclohydrolase FolE2 [Brucepastera parasyntrophica]